ncbi:MAG: BNR repeat-containing protein [Opitutaceae bacterium]|jgi:hypothetical protein|nr:BNR repeat-containing protein [Opitutaceae bacterium]
MPTPFPLPRAARPTAPRLLLAAAALLSSLAFSPRAAAAAPEPVILEQIDVAPVWSVHRAGPPELITRDDRQYVAYFDHDRFLTLAQRRLAERTWTYHRFPVQMGWETGSHAKLSLALDRDGYIHLACYRRNLLQEPPTPPAAIYYRSLAPHDIGGFEPLFMISPQEKHDYPTFEYVDGTLYFTFRLGGSGNGDQKFYRYDNTTRTWSSVLETKLLDGRGERSPYIAGKGLPVPGTDGRWHLLWMWRSTPDHATNHALSYARTVGSDLTRWETAGGVPVTPPFTVENRELWVDGAPEGGGLSNPLQALAWDAEGRPVISYHRFAEDGTSQIYNTRFIDGAWRPVPSTRWTLVWGQDYTGSGALNIYGTVRMGAVKPRGPNELVQEVWNRVDGGSLRVLDATTLALLREEPVVPPAWRQPLLRPESDFQIAAIPELRRLAGPLLVELIADTEAPAQAPERHYLRWEHGGANRDRPVPPPWPAPTMLRVYKVGAPR